MKKLVIRNTQAKGHHLTGDGVAPLHLGPHATATIGPAYYEHYHFKSMARKGILVVLRELEHLPPKPQAPKPVVKAAEPEPEAEEPTAEAASSTPRHRSQKQKAKKAKSENDNSARAMNLDGV